MQAALGHGLRRRGWVGVRCKVSYLAAVAGVGQEHQLIPQQQLDSAQAQLQDGCNARAAPGLSWLSAGQRRPRTGGRCHNLRYNLDGMLRRQAELLSFATTVSSMGGG